MYINKLYKYNPFDGDLKQPTQKKRKIGFEKGEIWYSKPKELNDPYDCKPIITIDNESLPEIISFLSLEEINYLKTKIKFKTIDELITKITTSQKIKHRGITIEQNWERFVFVSHVYLFQYTKMSNVGVLGLSTENNNILMWSHYANNHSGICLGLERNKKNLLGSSKTRKVIYLKHRPKISLIETMHEKFGKTGKMLFRKSYHWKTEKEWRNCKIGGNKTYPYPGNLIEVIFGANFPPNNIKMIKCIFGKKVKYFKAELGNDFEIVIKEITNNRIISGC